jgi:hypothetical protein
MGMPRHFFLPHGGDSIFSNLKNTEKKIFRQEISVIFDIFLPVRRFWMPPAILVLRVPVPQPGFKKFIIPYFLAGRGATHELPLQGR